MYKTCGCWFMTHLMYKLLNLLKFHLITLNFLLKIHNKVAVEL
jgi:hypothetical protein